MKNEIIKLMNDLYPYFKMLDNIDNYLTRIINDNMYNNPYQDVEIFYNITSELLRLLPYELGENGSFVLDKKSGILLLRKKFNFIVEKYNKIIGFEPFFEILSDIKFIRNKYIHQPHNITYAFVVNAKTSCSFGLRYKSKLLSISSITISPIVYYLNQIFDRIKNEVLEKIGDDRDYKNDYVYEIFSKFDFSRDKWHYEILPEYLMWGFNVTSK